MWSLWIIIEHSLSEYTTFKQNWNTKSDECCCLSTECCCLSTDNDTVFTRDKPQPFPQQHCVTIASPFNHCHCLQTVQHHMYSRKHNCQTPSCRPQQYPITNMTVLLICVQTETVVVERDTRYGTLQPPFARYGTLQPPLRDTRYGTLQPPLQLVHESTTCVQASNCLVTAKLLCEKLICYRTKRL